MEATVKIELISCSHLTGGHLVYLQLDIRTEICITRVQFFLTKFEVYCKHSQTVIFFFFHSPIEGAQATAVDKTPTWRSEVRSVRCFHFNFSLSSFLQICTSVIFIQMCLY